MKLVAKYALSYQQAMSGPLPRVLWDTLLAHEAGGKFIKHAEDPVRGVLTYEVYEKEPGESEPQAWDSVLAAQLRASLVVENERMKLYQSYSNALNSGLVSGKALDELIKKISGA